MLADSEARIFFPKHGWDSKEKFSSNHVLNLSFSRQELQERQAAVTTVPNRWVRKKPISLTTGLAQEKEKHFAARIKLEIRKGKLSWKPQYCTLVAGNAQGSCKQAYHPSRAWKQLGEPLPPLLLETR